MDSHFWTGKLDTLLKKKENTEFKDIKILLFFDMTTPDPHVFQSPGLELIIYQQMGLTYFKDLSPSFIGYILPKLFVCATVSVGHPVPWQQVGLHLTTMAQPCCDTANSPKLLLLYPVSDPAWIPIAGPWSFWNPHTS
jgi:hypothetical protein